MSDSTKQTCATDTLAQFRGLLEDLSGHFCRAPEGQRQRLLDFLENWKHSLRRNHPRKSCSVTVDYALGDYAFTGMIRNIGAGGAFIDAANGVAVGQQTTLAFWFPTLPRPTKIKGKIAWKSNHGFGVRFATSPYTEAGLEKAIERF